MQTIFPSSKETTMSKWHSVSRLIDEMERVGAAWTSRTGMILYEKKGKLTLPRSTNSRQDRQVTDEMIEEIVAAFSPGGAGEWHYQK